MHNLAVTARQPGVSDAFQAELKVAEDDAKLCRPCVLSVACISTGVQDTYLDAHS